MASSLVSVFRFVCVCVGLSGPVGLFYLFNVIKILLIPSWKFTVMRVSTLSGLGFGLKP